MTTKAPVWMDPRKLVPYAKNAKLHPQKQLDDLKASFKRFGFSPAHPILVDRDLEIIAGHGRTLAAIDMGIEVLVIVDPEISKTEAAALRLADNQTVSNQFDIDLVQSELRFLSDSEVSFDGLGYSDKELDFLTTDLSEMNLGAFVGDLTEAVEEQKSQNEVKSVEIDAATAPIGDALGVKRITVAQSRRLRAFMVKIEAETGKSGAEALMAFLDEFGVE